MQASATPIAELLPELERLPQDWAYCACNGSKAPLGDGWQQTPMAVHDFEAAIEAGRFSQLSIKPKSGTRDAFHPPVGWCKAVGVLCGEPSGGLLMFDHDGKSCDQWIVEKTGLSLKEALPQSPLVTSGRPGRYQIAYKVPQCHWESLNTTKLKTGRVGDDGKPEQVEFRWSGCQSVVLGQHPTHGSYQWVHHPQDKEIAPAPAWMLEMMQRASSSPLSSSSNRGEVIPLEVCLSPDSRRTLEGNYGGGRNDTGFLLARDLFGTAEYLRAIGQRFEGDPAQIFMAWCRSENLDKDDPLGQPEAIWKNIERKKQPPFMAPYKIEGCIEAYFRRQRQSASVSSNGNKRKSSLRSDQNATDEKSDAECLQEDLQAYQQESDPFERVLLENNLSSSYRVRGRRLGELLDALNPAPLSDFQALDELSAEIFVQIEERSESGVVPGYLSGFNALDAIVQGFQGGDLAIIAARPSMGKTALATAIARQISEIYAVGVAFFSLEMSKHQLYYRLLSVESGVEFQKLRSGSIKDDLWPDIFAALGRLSALQILIDDTSNITPSVVRKKYDALQDKGHQINLVLIDYLQLMSSDVSYETNALEVARITRELKVLAKDKNIPLIVLSQLSRAVESRSDKRPIMSDLRDSGGIEQDADLVMMIYRDEYYKPETIDKGVAEVNIVKHRNGPTGIARLNFEPRLAKFTN